ncbi:MAG: hypothetical protein U0271_38725 [Polyangiaceae bacterium]
MNSDTPLDLPGARAQHVRAHTALVHVCEAAVDGLIAYAAERGVKLSYAVDASAEIGPDPGALYWELRTLLEAAVGRTEPGGRAGIEVVSGPDANLVSTAWTRPPRASSNPAPCAA